MKKKQLATEEKRTERASDSPESEDTFVEYYKLTDVVLKAALDEL